MESAFSSDFAAVRLHTGAAAHDATSALGARALTAGTDILFRTGEYQPGTPGGDRLLAHELAHVVQQAHGLPQGILDTGATDHLETAAGLAADHASPAAEREAHGAAMTAAMGKPVPALSGQPPTIARQDDLDDPGSNPPDAGTSLTDVGTSTPAPAAFVPPPGLPPTGPPAQAWVCGRPLRYPVLNLFVGHSYVRDANTPPNVYSIISPLCTPTDGGSDNFLTGTAARKWDNSPDPCGDQPQCVECLLSRA